MSDPESTLSTTVPARPPSFWDLLPATRWLGSYAAPNLTSLVTGEPSPPIQNLPAAPGKVPSTDDPRIPMAGFEAANLAANFLPAGWGSKMAMAAAMVPSRGGRLTTDIASSMARAREMGFHLDIPLAHGTDRAFRAFDPSLLGSTTQAAPARAGVWMEVNPAAGAGVADFHADIAAKRNLGYPQVYPLVHRADNPANLRLTGDETILQIAATLAKAWDDGRDAVMIHNYTGPTGKPATPLVVKDPAQLRSPRAVFDPAKRDSRDLLAGLGGTAVGAGGVLGSFGQDRDL